MADYEHGRRIGPAPPLTPLSDSPAPGRRGLARAGKPRPLSLGDNAVARAVGRLPATLHVKLLIAFVGTAVLVAAVGLLGLRVLGESNDRAERLGALQKRAFSYGRLQSDAYHVRLLQAESVDRAFYTVWPGALPTVGRASAIAMDGAVLNAIARIGPSTLPDRLGFVPPAEDGATSESLGRSAGRASGSPCSCVRSPGSSVPARRLRTPWLFAIRPSFSQSTSTDLRRCSPTGPLPRQTI